MVEGRHVSLRRSGWITPAALLYLQVQTAAGVHRVSPERAAAGAAVPRSELLAGRAAGMAHGRGAGHSCARWGMTVWASHDGDAWQICWPGPMNVPRRAERQVTSMLRTCPSQKELAFTLRASGLKADVQFLAASQAARNIQSTSRALLPISRGPKKGLRFRNIYAWTLRDRQAHTSDTNTDTVLRATPSQTRRLSAARRSIIPCAATLPQSLKKSKPVRLMHYKQLRVNLGSCRSHRQFNSSR